MAEKKGFEVEDILEEQRAKREGRQAPPREEVPAPQEEPRGASAPEPEERAPEKKKKKEKRGFFGRRNKVPDFDEAEDTYYGIQLKPIDEYRKGYDPATGEFSMGSYDDLFDDSKKAIDDEVEENFQRLQRERRRRVAEAVQTAGVDEEEIADEFGVVAPMPVTAFAADPYARQHGIEVEGAPNQQENMPDIQKAMLETSSDQTMEIKLNVLNDTMEIQRIRDIPAVSDESINKILETADRAENLEDQPPEAVADPTHAELAQPEPAGETASQPREESEPEQPAAAQEEPASEDDEDGQSLSDETGRPVAEIPRVSSIYEYRFRSVPTHVVNADLLQSALLSESEELMQAAQDSEKHSAHRRVRARAQEEPQEEPVFDPDQSMESIDDFTGPEDVQSISHELRSDMRELTMRATITGVCTALLTVLNLIFGPRLSGAGDMGSLPLVYIILTVVFLGVAVGVCFRTVINGLKALFSFNANSDSGVALAAVTVAAQTLASIFFRDELAEGRLHLYAVVLTAFLFLNAAGKLTMIRRIHSNFRFVSSKEQKYAVRTYEDYNTALKMTKDVVAEKPVVAYQCRAGFLKRFLELSYDPDPAETASQLLAPIGLISSLVLCIVCLLVTRSVPTALSALAAASCACVAVSNMLAVNLPISRLCKTARRAGAMVVGYDAVEQLGNVNALLVDAEEIFPRGTVILNGIKTFGNRAGAEEAIMDASAVMKEVGGPLSGVFDQVISENEDALPEVEEFSCETGGIVARVDGKAIHIGTRNLLMDQGIEVPAKEEESQYASGSQNVIYLAVENTVAAMLVLSYSADRRRRNELQRLENSGISVLVHTTDPNVTVQMISRMFGIDSNSVTVLEGELGNMAGKLTGMNIPRADAVVATKGRVESMMNVVSECVNEKRTVSVVVAIQNAAVILGFVLVAFMASFGGMRQLTSFILFAFELFWFLVILVIPKLRR